MSYECVYYENVPMQGRARSGYARLTVGGLVFIAIFALIVFFVVKAANAANKAMQAELNLVNTGIPAQGIFLQVAPTGTRQLINGYRYERRSVVLDVELPGQPPYQLGAMPLIPVSMIRSVLPGVSVQLRIDPKNSQSVAIVAPGNLPPSYFLQAPRPQ